VVCWWVPRQASADLAGDLRLETMIMSPDIRPFQVCSLYTVPLTRHQRSLVRGHYRWCVRSVGALAAKQSCWRLSLTYALGNQY
jgi:hypothetical protein